MFKIQHWIIQWNSMERWNKQYFCFKFSLNQWIFPLCAQIKTSTQFSMDSEFYRKDWVEKKKKEGDPNDIDFKAHLNEEAFHCAIWVRLINVRLIQTLRTGNNPRRTKKKKNLDSIICIHLPPVGNRAVSLKAYSSKSFQYRHYNSYKSSYLLRAFGLP